jgi:hypothetical protein
MGADYQGPVAAVRATWAEINMISSIAVGRNADLAIIKPYSHLILCAPANGNGYDAEESAEESAKA